MLENRSLSEIGRSELARKLGFVSTEVVRVQGLRVRDLVVMGRYPHTGWFGRLTPRDRDMIERAIELTSLGDLADRDLDELSDGERQRAMIARTLAQDTGILLLDEPTAFLDLAHKYEITLLLGKLAREEGKTVIFSTHDLQLCLQEADKIWLMMKGGLVEGAPEDLVLDGQLEEGLVGEKELVIDPGSGQLVHKREGTGEIRVSGEAGPVLDWTLRSLMRMGFRISEGPDLALHLQLDKTGGTDRWILEKSGHKQEFKSIYDLSLYLRTIV
jgi:iron complex transport system ATP-binding protein